MAENAKRMPEITEELYFVIEEKNNSIDLTDKGIAHLSGDNEDHFFVLPDMGIEVGKIDAKEISVEEKANDRWLLCKCVSMSVFQQSAISRQPSTNALSTLTTRPPDY